MKNFLLVLIVIVIVIVLYLISGGKEIFDDSSKKNLPTKVENTIVNEVESKSLNTEGISSSDLITPQDLKNERAKYPSGIKITTLDEANLSDKTRTLLKQKFDNLHKYGNFNANKLAGEFKHIKKYKKNINKDYPLSFVPTENEFLEKNFNLTGKYASGAYSKGVGFNSYTRLFENKETLQKVELTEMYLNPKTHSLIEVYKESFNEKINGLDLTFQEIPVGNTTVFTVDFFNNQKMFSLSTIRVQKEDVEDLVSSLITQSNNPMN